MKDLGSELKEREVIISRGCLCAYLVLEVVVYLDLLKVLESFFFGTPSAGTSYAMLWRSCPSQ